MHWHTILLQLQDLQADPYLAQVRNDFVRWMLARIVASPAAGDTRLAEEHEAKGLPAALNLTALANEYRAAKGIPVHEDRCRWLEEQRVLAAHRKAVG